MRVSIASRSQVAGPGQEDAAARAKIEEIAEKIRFATENLDEELGEVVSLIGARDESLARRVLYFSTFEDMLF